MHVGKLRTRIWILEVVRKAWDGLSAVSLVENNHFVGV